jgi:5-methylcytosine-specific restriction protein A
VTLADVTRAGLLAAVEEFNRLGREAFLAAHGFSRSKAYFLDHEGQLYDSKPLMGHAHGVDTGTPWGPRDFSGGDKTVARQLEDLGFTVAFLPNPEWTRDELILACEAVEANGWQRLDINDERVRVLSHLLQSPAIHRGRRNPEFRNPAGVALKTRSLATPGQGHLCDEIRGEFLADPVGMRALAGRTRELLQTPDGTYVGPDPADLDIDEIGAREGGVALRAHLRRERDPRLRRLKIAEAKRGGEPIACEACGFDFGRVYGDRGRDYIECHHRTPLHVTGETDTRLSDLALICSNCHRMVHRTHPWLTVEALRVLVACRTKG